MQRIRLGRSEAAQEERLLSCLYEHGVLGIIEEETQFQAFFPDEVAIAAILGEQRNAFLGIEQVNEEEGIESSTIAASFDGLCVGDRFYVGPSAFQEFLPPGRLHLRVDGSQAFGTGRHESTQLMLEFLEKDVRPQHFVVDVGSGSGILSQAASLLRAKTVVSCDIDEAAVRQGKEASGALSFVGSVDALESKAADLLLVNISAAVIDDLAAQLRRVLKPDGLLVASGFIRGRVPERLKPDLVTERDDWQCWVCRPEGILVNSDEARRILRHAAHWW